MDSQSIISLLSLVITTTYVVWVTLKLDKEERHAKYLSHIIHGIAHGKFKATVTDDGGTVITDRD